MRGSLTNIAKLMRLSRLQLRPCCLSGTGEADGAGALTFLNFPPPISFSEMSKIHETPISTELLESPLT